MTEAAKVFDSLTIVLPAYNEEASLPEAIGQCDSLRNALGGWRLQVIVVDDGSTDETGQVLKELKLARPWLEVVRHESNLGYGRALRTGFAAAKNDLVFYTDSDNQFDLLEVVGHLPRMLHADLVTGFRVYRFDPLARLVASWCYNRMVSVLFRVRVRDVDCSFKLMNRRRLDHLVLMSDDFFIDTEIIARARKWNWRIVEVGVRHFPRAKGQTTVKPSDVPRTLARVVAMWKHIHYANRQQHHDLVRQQQRQRADLRGPDFR